MYLNHELRQAYIRVPKTASNTFLRSWELAGVNWESQGSPHLALREVTVPDGYSTLGFVRDPVDWAISAWNHARMTPKPTILGYGMCSFLDYVRNVNLTPLEYLSDGDKRADLILRSEDMDTYLTAQGIVPVRMGVRVERLEPDLTDEVMDAIRTRFADDYTYLDGMTGCQRSTAPSPP